MLSVDCGSTITVVVEVDNHSFSELPRFAHFVNG